MKNRIAVDTPAYGRNTPDGSFTTASSFWSSTNALRSVLCALLEPNSTPSGTITAARPPGLSNEEQREEEQFGLLRLDHALQVLGRRLVVQRPGERRIGQDQRVLRGIVAGALGQRVAVADVGASMPCSSMFMLPMRSMVESKS